MVKPVTAAASLTLDCETGNAPEEAIDGRLRDWQPPANYRDPEKIQARRLEAADKLRERSALFDESPVLCVAVTDGQPIVLNGMDGELYEIESAEVLSFGGERAMLEGLAEYCNTVSNDDTVLVGHNLRFDLPKLRQRYLAHGLQLPRCLMIDKERPQPLFDTMRTFARHCSIECNQSGLISLEAAARLVGISTPKNLVSGADIPILHQEGNVREILTYCLLDCLITQDLYRILVERVVIHATA